MNSKSKFVLTLLLIILALLLLTYIISLLQLDLRIANRFYNHDKWHWAKGQPWWWLFKYGTYPGIIVAVAALLALLISIKVRSFVPYRRYSLFILLTLAIGPGMLVNGVFKDRWGRPRPRECIEFGGKWEFREVWQPGIPGKGHSFPSGHAAMGFNLIVLYYLLKRRHKKASYLLLSCAVVYGSLMAIARMIQGAHFLSDGLWAAGITFLTAEVVYFSFVEYPNLKDEKQLPLQSRLKKNLSKWIICFTAIVAIIWIFLLSKPAYHEHEYMIPHLTDVSAINFEILNAKGNIYIETDECQNIMELVTTVTALGYPRKKMKSRTKYNIRSDTLHIKSTLEVRGFFRKYNGNTHIKLSTQFPISITATTANGNITFDNSKNSNNTIASLKLAAPHGSVMEIGL